MKIENKLSELQKQCQEIGLDFATLLLHQQRLVRSLQNNEKQIFKVLDTCRIDNGGILPQDFWQDQEDPGEKGGYIAFVPAAGAASRYFQPLFSLGEGLKKNDFLAIKNLILDLKKMDALSWPLPSPLVKLLREMEQMDTMAQSHVRELAASLDKPKALLPCVIDGNTFLELKIREHAVFPEIGGQIYVVPPGQTKDFENAVSTISETKNKPVLFLEQGPKLSTLRFSANGAPVLEEDGSISLVPAGHGSLVRLFGDAAIRFPGAHSLLIRNIDNVQGTKEEAVLATRRFLAVHSAIKRSMDKIRTLVKKNSIPDAAEVAKKLLELTSTGEQAINVSRFLKMVKNPDIRILWEVQFRVFHSCQFIDAPVDDFDTLKKLYERPLNTLGQVPNTGKDMGGTPVFVEVGNSVQKVCLEIPHASEEDKIRFFADPAKATHFNPVFIAAEISNNRFSQQNDAHCPFWMLAAKKYRNQQVYYHEILLSEILGNSEACNTVFLEIPRALFNPHKALEDARDRTLSFWLEH